MMPRKVDEIDRTFGGRADLLLPVYSNIPDAFKRGGNEWAALVERWFFKGLNAKLLMAQSHVDRGTALGYLCAIMASRNPNHEHKIAGVAYLMSLWFEPVTETAA